MFLANLASETARGECVNVPGFGRRSGFDQRRYHILQSRHTQWVVTTPRGTIDESLIQPLPHPSQLGGRGAAPGHAAPQLYAIRGLRGGGVAQHLGKAVVAAHSGMEWRVAHAASGVNVSLSIEQELDGLDPAKVRRDVQRSIAVAVKPVHISTLVQ